MAQHHATFTWGAGPQTVHVAGGFNQWSATASPLEKQPDGTFKSEIPVPWGEKQAFKYVVDGEWKVREDEAKEWDAAGNMNNVYTAPHAPAPSPVKAAPVPAPAAAVPSSPVKAAPAPASPVKAPAPEPIPVPEPVPAMTADKAEPSELMAASAPAAASTGLPFILGNPVGSTTPAKTISSEPAVATSPVKAAPVVVPVPATQPTPTAPATKEQMISSAEAIEKTAARANVGEAELGPHEDTILEKASAVGASALAGITAYVGAAAVAVEKATGIDLTHGEPLSIEEAKAQGLDLNQVQKRDAETDAVSPVNSKPPSAAVDDLDRKVQDLKIGSLATKPEEPERKPDIPAQPETFDDHKTVPMPIITAVTESDPRKDRTIEGTSAIDTAGTKPIASDPSVSAKVAKKEAETNPATTGSTMHHAANGTASTPVTGAAATGPLPAGGAPVSPNQPAANHNAPPPPQKDTSGIDAAPTTSMGAALVVAPPASSTAAKTSPADAAMIAQKPSPVAPSTPSKSGANGLNGIATATPGSLNSTPASSPAKPVHTKEATGGSDMRKRKSSFFHKIKEKFSSPKDNKEKK